MAVHNAYRPVSGGSLKLMEELIALSVSDDKSDACTPDMS